MDITIQIISCVLGTIAFAISMKAPKHALIFISLGALISTSIERVMSQFFNEFLTCFTAMLVLSLYCEIIARIIKEPTTITLVPSTIPLLPGSAIYYTMLSLIGSDIDTAKGYAKSTILTGLGIALGAVISSTLIKAIYKIRNLNV